MKVNLLKGKIVSLGIKTDTVIEKLSEQGINMSKVTWYRKLNGHSEFDRKEIKGLIDILDLSPEETESIFFN